MDSMDPRTILVKERIRTLLAEAEAARLARATATDMLAEPMDIPERSPRATSTVGGRSGVGERLRSAGSAIAHRARSNGCTAETPCARPAPTRSV